MIDRSAEAVANFEAGCGCAQAVFVAYAPDLGMDRETAMKISASFGSGMGRMREVCGCCSAMFLVAGMLTGATDPADRAAKTRNYEVVRHLADRFREKTGSIICREMLAGIYVANDGTAVPEERTEEFYKRRPCRELVRLAATIIAEEL